MIKELEALKELYEYAKIDDFNDVRETSIIYQLLKSALEQKEKLEKVFEIIKSIDFSLEFDESQNEWFLYIYNEKQGMLVAKGTGIKTYDLLKEMLNE